MVLYPDRGSTMLIEHADACRATKTTAAFDMDAMVIRPDHLQARLTLPEAMPTTLIAGAVAQSPG